MELYMIELREPVVDTDVDALVRLLAEVIVRLCLEEEAA
jgi:hypothetical protein